ncbi:MAG: hypothetical protein A2052_02055 [Deltaproteobacteria bacterium GWA2_54_12]|nr:MAG: hypothetical protein A2052_02055 [Deltaproteobacteria bacterium GWA2_54_12]
MNKQTILDSLDFKAFYKEAVPSLTGESQASGNCPLPGHDDEKASFSVNLDTGLFNCHGCGKKGDIFTFYQAHKGVDFKTALKELAGIAGVIEKGGKQEKAVYDYTDEDGAFLYQVVRYEPKDFRPRRKGPKDEWIYNLEGVRRVPYNLSELVNASGAVIVEGEKDADNLKALGYTGSTAVTTSQGGAKGWKAEYAEHFLNKQVAIIPDNDRPGLEYAETVARSLQGKASVIRIVELPGLGERKEKHGLDVSNWIDLRRNEGRTDQEIKGELAALIKAASPWESKSENTPEKYGPDILSSLESWNHIQSLDIKVEYGVDRLIPKESITLLFGKGGIGKTWLMMDMARSIGGGIPFLGLTTLKAPVIFVDFENPLAVLNARTQKLGDAEGVYFWRSNNEKLKAPKLDSPDWEIYKNLPKGAVLIFDTLRASHGKDENASNDMGLIMGKLKELRDMGFTIILLHHTPKNSDKMSKGSTAIVDLADHILGLTLVRKKQDGQEVVVDDDDSEEDAVYRFGVREKTRFEPYHVYLTLNPDRGFELAPDPQEDSLKEMHRILVEHGTLTKTAFLEYSKSLSLGRGKLRKLFEIGQGRYWTVEVKTDQRNAHFVTPIQSASLPSLYRGEQLNNCSETAENAPARHETMGAQKNLVNTEFASLPNGCPQTGKLDLLEGEV